MKLLRWIPICTAATALMLVQAIPAFQTEETTGAATKAEKKASKKAKKTTEQTGDMTGKPGVAGSTGAATMTEKGTSQTPEVTKKGRSATAGSAQRAETMVPESEIAAAKASGKVWVNTDTGVYHKGGRWYGATKKGKFMTEDEAKKAGYRASKEKE